MPFESLVEQISRWSDAADGLTISGGEPFEQPDALRELLLWWNNQQRGDVLVFSGLSWEQLQSSYPDVLKLIDVLISDPFEAGADQTLPLRGSDNQRLHCLTPLGQERYQHLPEQHVLDVCLDGDKVWLAGIPRQGDLAKLRSQLQGLGLELSTSDQAGCMP
jgi:anaerobic ribonucleoside-triphosphate reductase activating protein